MKPMLIFAIVQFILVFLLLLAGISANGQTQTAIGITQSKKIWGDDTKYSVYIGIFVALPKNDPAFFPKCTDFNFVAIKGAYNDEVARLKEKYPASKFREVILRYPSPMKGQVTQNVEVELTFDQFKEIVCK